MDNRIPRSLDSAMGRWRPGRATVVYGPRQVGKTNLVEHYLAGRADGVLRVNGDDIRVRNLLQSQDAGQVLAWAEGYDIVFLDEAQRIPGVGWSLKILVDSRPELRVIATGSASFALAGQLGEPLTGRHTPMVLYPVSVLELAERHNDHELTQMLPDLLVHGMYPEVRTAATARDKREILRELTSSYLFKDILELERVKSSKLLVDLLTLVALQQGQLVSVNELGRALGLSAKTVSRYLDLFEKAFVLRNLRGFSRNRRKEITKKSKWYFYDNGVRNALLNNFAGLDARADVGALWEAFGVMERVKVQAYAGRAGGFYFWRDWDGQEVDLVEERDGQLHAFEFKTAAGAKARPPAQFAGAYPQATYDVVTPANLVANLRAAAAEPKQDLVAGMPRLAKSSGPSFLIGEAAET